MVINAAERLAVRGSAADPGPDIICVSNFKFVPVKFLQKLEEI